MNRRFKSDDEYEAITKDTFIIPFSYSYNEASIDIYSNEAMSFKKGEYKENDKCHQCYVKFSFNEKDDFDKVYGLKKPNILRLINYDCKERILITETFSGTFENFVKVKGKELIVENGDIASMSEKFKSLLQSGVFDGLEDIYDEGLVHGRLDEPYSILIKEKKDVQQIKLFGIKGSSSDKEGDKRKDLNDLAQIIRRVFKESKTMDPILELFVLYLESGLKDSRSITIKDVKNHPVFKDWKLEDKERYIRKVIGSKVKDLYSFLDGDFIKSLFDDQEVKIRVAAIEEASSEYCDKYKPNIFHLVRLIVNSFGQPYKGAGTNIPCEKYGFLNYVESKCEHFVEKLYCVVGHVPFQSL